jgi:hypothetical protein
LRALEEALLNFAGLRRRHATTDGFSIGSRRICGIRGDSEVVWFEGNYQDARPTEAAARTEDQPHRIKYHRLTR